MDIGNLAALVQKTVEIGISLGLAYWGLKHGLVELISDVYGFIHKKIK